MQLKQRILFNEFNLLQKLNSLKTVTDNDAEFLTSEQRKTIIELCHKSPSVKYSDLRKKLALQDNQHFNDLTYGDKDVEEVEKKPFKYLDAYHEMRKAYDKGIAKDYFKAMSIDKKDALGYALTVYKTDDKIGDYLSKNGFSDIEIQVASNIKTFSKTGNLSVEAMRKIIPFLEKGMKYNEAAEAAGYNFKAESGAERTKYLPPLPNDTYEITSPVVKRAISQTIKVINAIVRQYGSPCKINIELARELSKNFKDRMKIKKDQEENYAKNENAKRMLSEELHVDNPTHLDVVKYRLYEEQDGRCPYTGETLEINRLYEEGYCDIDHIIPYSISFDDTYTNKVLVKTYANREKGNRVPLEYVSNQGEYIVRVNNMFKGNKLKNLLTEKLSEEKEMEMKRRNLQDTQFITDFVYRYISNNLLFEEIPGRKRHVNAVNGRITALVRKRWGINKIRGNGDLHHAVDAVVVGCITDGNIQRITKYSQWYENKFNKIMSADDYERIDKKRKFPLPWEQFREELEIRLSNNPEKGLLDYRIPTYDDVDFNEIKPLFVSRMPKHKHSGQAHQETVRGKREKDNKQYVVTKTDITKLKINPKTGEIDNYYNPDSDRRLYQLIKNRLKAHGNNGEKAFAEPLYKPSPKGGTAPVVKKVKTVEPLTLGVDVNSGVAGNGDMVRIDLFHVEGEGYYFVPIYVADLVKDKLPNKASVHSKSYEQWKEMKEEDFLFSIYPNDLIKITSKKEMKFTLNNEESNLPKEYQTESEFVYYVKAGISVASIAVETHDRAYKIASLGIKSLLSIEKYEVDVLGNIKKAGFVKRQLR